MKSSGHCRALGDFPVRGQDAIDDDRMRECNSIPHTKCATRTVFNMNGVGYFSPVAIDAMYG